MRNASWLGRRSPLAKLAALALITLALVATIDAVSAAVVAAASFVMLGLAGIRPLAFLGRIWPFAVGAVIAVWGTAIAGEESGRVLLDLGFTTVSSGSLLLGVALGLRAFAIVLPSVIILSTTDPTDLADSLAQQLKLPARFVLGALAAMRLMGLLAEHWSTLGHARRARGIGAKKGLLGESPAPCPKRSGCWSRRSGQPHAWPSPWNPGASAPGRAPGHDQRVWCLRMLSWCWQARE